MKVIDMTGKVFGRLTVLSRDFSGESARAHWLCRCTCGNEKVIVGKHLRDGMIVSCGCFRKERSLAATLTHGQARAGKKTVEYAAWKSMKRRCYNKNNKDYPAWGGRGIMVCDRWKHSFENFFADMGSKPSPRHSLDRYPNNDGNYEPTNCRWATMSQQAKNSHLAWPRRKRDSLGRFTGQMIV